MWTHDTSGSGVQCRGDEARFHSWDAHDGDSLGAASRTDGVDDIGEENRREWRVFGVDECPVKARHGTGYSGLEGFMEEGSTGGARLERGAYTFWATSSEGKEMPTPTRT